jgi:gluconate 2-dehydrogenase gamma chain
VINRRELLVGSAAASAALMSGCFTRRTPWAFFTADEARTLTVLCDQIIPADDYPSASQAGALTFIDCQLTRHYQPHQEAYRDGLRLTEGLSHSRFGAYLAQASGPQQYKIVVEVERELPEFFELVRRHTLQGYYGSPRHGGNRDAVSWRMLGLAEPPLRGRAQYDLAQYEPASGLQP